MWGSCFGWLLKKIVDEKSSFGNGWRFFILQKVREAGCDGKTSDRAVEGGRVRGDGLLAGKLKPAIYSKTKKAVTRDSLFQGYIFV